MAKTPKQQYQDDNYDRVAIRVKKGLRDEYQRAAAEFGISFRELVQCGVEEFIQRHGGEALPRLPAPMESTPALPRHPARITTQPAEQISATQRRLLEAVEKLPADAQKSLLKFLQSLNVAAENKAENTAENASVDAQEPI